MRKGGGAELMNFFKTFFVGQGEGRLELVSFFTKNLNEKKILFVIFFSGGVGGGEVWV